MDYVDGLSLADRLKEGPLTIELAIDDAEAANNADGAFLREADTWVNGGSERLAKELETVREWMWRSTDIINARNKTDPIRGWAMRIGDELSAIVFGDAKKGAPNHEPAKNRRELMRRLPPGWTIETRSGDLRLAHHVRLLPQHVAANHVQASASSGFSRCGHRARTLAS